MLWRPRLLKTRTTVSLTSLTGVSPITAFEIRRAVSLLAHQAKRDFLLARDRTPPARSFMAAALAY